jgi:two-component system, chemotaxis family, protein-glutamate methylesterase/glutaminase
MQTRDFIVVGASLGGIEALSTLVGGLSADLPAALLVVQHTADNSPALLAEILANRGPLPAVTAETGMEPRRGCIHVAPPDRHLLLAADGMRVVFGPRENRSRPAIDPLFRTAAVNYRSRVVAVILTGLLGDGAAGLLAVERCGGMPLVQDPGDAAYPEMPRAALATVAGARQVTISELGPLLSRLTREPAPEPPPVPDALQIEARLTERAMRTEDWNQVPGRSTNFTCPDCRGAIREVEEEGMRRYRCRVGHAFSTEAMVAARDDSVEEALWVALQTLQERAQMLEAMVRDDRGRGWERSAASMEERAREARAHADRLREFVARISA